MAKTYAQIVDDAEALLQDSANAVFAATEFDSIMTEALVAISQFKPWQYRLTKTTTTDSYDIELTLGDKWRLLEGSGYKGTGIVKAEYLVDQNPRKFRGLTIFANTLTLELDSPPSSAVNVYLYMNKIHLLQKEIGTTDTTGAIKTQAAVGATALGLKSLGTGTINEMTYLSITGDATTYVVIAQATIAANEATVSIWPPLQAVAAADAVVTLALAAATFDITLEGYLARYLAAQAAISKATLTLQQVKTAITTLTNAGTAIEAIAALTALATTANTGDIALGRAAEVLAATTITAATVGSTARITQAVADIASGRAELVKIVGATPGAGILDTVNTEIDKMLALLGASAGGATKDLTDGRTELEKSDDLITAGATIMSAAIIGVAAMLETITNANTGSLKLAKDAIALGVKSINDTLSAHTEIGKIDAATTGPLVVAASALATGAPLLNTIQPGDGAKEYMAQAAQDVGLAQGYLMSGQGYLQEAAANFNNAVSDLAVTSKILDVATAKIQEGHTKFDEATADITLNRAYIESSMAKLRVAQAYFQEAQGYVMEINARIGANTSYIQSAIGELRAASGKNAEGQIYLASAQGYYAAAAADFRAASEKANEAIAGLRLVASRLQVSQGGLRYEEWGRRQLAEVRQELLNHGGCPYSVRYARD